MNRSTYAIISLSSLLAAGVLLAITFSNVPLTPRSSTITSTASTLASIDSATRPTVQNPPPAPLPLEPQVHDPSLIRQGDYYYVFYTGNLINCLRSKDLLHWESPTALPATPPTRASATNPATTPARGARATRAGRSPSRLPSVFPAMPNSVSASLPATRDLWAPDIAFYNGKYLLYYAASSFGSRNSAIGLASNKTLDPASRDYQWHDDGVILRSTVSDEYNAIDPNFVLDEIGRPWLAFGSFWSGIKLRRLTPNGTPDSADPTLYSLASRTAPETAIEAPAIIREGRYFYLFVSWDRCCQGLQSTYRIMVGRSEKITGPYLDKNGTDMAQGGGTQLLVGDGKRLIGPGGQSLFHDTGRWLMALHFYDGNTNGTARLQIRPVSFDEKLWPTLANPLNSPG